MLNLISVPAITWIPIQCIGTTLCAERWCCLSSLLGYWAQFWTGRHSDTAYQQAGNHFVKQSQPHLVLVQQQNGIWTQDPRIPRITCKLFEKDTETLIIHQQMLTDESDSFTSFWWPIYTLIHLSLHAKQQRDRLKKGPDSNPGSTAQKWVCKLCISAESKISCHTGLPH